VDVLDAERARAARDEADREPQLVDLELGVALLGERIERWVGDNLIELGPGEQELAVAVADVAGRGLLAAGREQLRLDALLVEQCRPRLELFGPGDGKGERERAARDGEHGDEPPVAPGLPGEVDQSLQAVAGGYRWKRHLRNDGTRARRALRACIEPTLSPANPGTCPSTGSPSRTTSSVSWTRESNAPSTVAEPISAPVPTTTATRMSTK